MLKRIALHIEKDQACPARTATAVALARRFHAELLGIYVDYPWPVDTFGETVVPSVLYEMMLQQHNQERSRCRAEFDRQVAGTDIAVQWRTPEGRPDDVLALHSRCADLLVLSQANSRTTDSMVDPFLVETIIMSAGRPVLVLPYAREYTRIGNRVLFCWDRGREATRALADAAPFIGSAEETFVLTLDEQDDAMRARQTDPDDLPAWFRAHGYRLPTVLMRETAELGYGNAILNTASDHGCDLIVMGLYGHNRLREWVMGGASRDMLATMTTPVLFSH